MESSETGSGVKAAMANRSPRKLSIVALLALVPVVLFVFGRSTMAVVAGLNVVLIFGCLYLLTSPTEGEAHGDHPSAATDDETPESAV